MYDNEIKTPPPEPRRGGNSVWIGVAFVLLGVVLILRATHVVALANWWALFILIPAVGSFGSAVNSFRRSGNRFTKPVAGSVGGGLFFAMLSAMFLFDLDWGQYWPVFIILAGISILLSGFARGRG